MRLLLPIKDICITQPFGVNWIRSGFYKSLGIPTDLHNGVDFDCKIGTRITAAHDGVVTLISNDKNAGLGVEICTAKIGKGFKSIYWHFDKVLTDLNKVVKRGDLIGLGGNTGFSTGSHLHFGFKETQDAKTINNNNGYLGAIDPAPHFAERHGENWDKPAVFNRYGRNKDWTAEWKIRFKNAWIHRQLIARGRHPLSLRDYEVNALVYGAWDWDVVMSDGMWEIYRHLTKDEYKNGRRPYID